MIVAGITITQALDLPTAARLLYPHSIRLQRQWIAAYLVAPGPRCRVGLMPDRLPVSNNRHDFVR